jgi:hypothetical protein
MLKMQIGPKKCMKTKGHMTKRPRNIAILCPKVQNSRGILAFLHEILPVLRTKTGVGADLYRGIWRDKLAAATNAECDVLAQAHWALFRISTTPSPTAGGPPRPSLSGGGQLCNRRARRGAAGVAEGGVEPPHS